MDIFYLDVSKVFGRVSYRFVPEKSLCDSLGKMSVQWVGIWLPGHTWRVVAISSLGNSQVLTGGVPPGLVSGSTLCDIFMWKLGSSIFCPSSPMITNRVGKYFRALKEGLDRLEEQQEKVLRMATYNPRIQHWDLPICIGALWKGTCASWWTINST